MANIDITSNFLPKTVGDYYTSGGALFGNLFDEEESGKYYAGETFPHGGTFQYFPYTRKLTRIELKCRLDSQSPKTFTVYGSSTGAFGGEETSILSVVDTSQMATDEVRGWDIVGADAYRYFFIEFTEGYDSTYTNLHWTKVYADDGETLESPINGTYSSNISATATISAQNNSAAASTNLSDDDTATVWFGIANPIAEWIQLEFSSAKLVNKFNYIARGDGAPDQAPLRIVIKGSATGAFLGEEVELFDTGIFEVFWLELAEELSLEFQNSTDYSYFRLYVSDSSYKSASEIQFFETIEATQVETPVITPTSGAYQATQLITISSATSGATIFYTEDGSTPDATDTEYTVPFELISSKTIKAIGIKDGFDDSDITTEVYIVVVIEQVEAPVFNPSGGSYSIDASISITSVTPNNQIYYTTNGSTPSDGSTLYTGPIPNFNGTLKAIAVSTGYINSNTTTDTYTIAAPIDWQEDRDRGPWDFTEQPDKWGYLNNPRWTKNAASENQHLPCGHWHKHPRGSGISFEEFPIPPGRWVAALTQRSQKFIYLYARTINAVIQISLETTPYATDVLYLDPLYGLDTDKGTDGAQKGGYCINKTDTRLWYLFRTDSNCQIAEVDITGGTMSLVRKTDLPGILSGDVIMDGCADDGHTYWCTDLLEGRIIKIRNSDHVVVDNHLFTLNEFECGYIEQGITQIDVLPSGDALFWNYVLEGCAGYNACVVYVRSDTSFNIELEVDACSLGFSTPWAQNLLQIHDNYVIQHRSYYPSSGPMSKWADGTYGIPLYDYSQRLLLNQQFLLNMFGVNDANFFTLWHSNQVSVQTYIDCINFGGFTTVSTKQVNYYVGRQRLTGFDWDVTNVSALNNNLLTIIRFDNVEQRNYLAVFQADQTLEFVSDTPIDHYRVETGTDTFPDQSTNNEPQVWAMPGQTYDEKNNID